MVNTGNTKFYLKRRDQLKKFLDDNEDRVKSAKVELDLLNKMIAVSGDSGGSGSNGSNGNGASVVLSGVLSAQIIQLMNTQPDEIWTRKEFIEELGITNPNGPLGQLLDDGLVKRIGRGQYQLTAKGKL